MSELRDTALRAAWFADADFQRLVLRTHRRELRTVLLVASAIGYTLGMIVGSYLS
ncbi:hypothetical protein ACIBG8_54480 [Nonomuraea sp. NPDC050556]|uniref:hypothetical protein n=1 Tax=Nonomuraea sp. NPDC050556 TaxID=3364369 RepID=UPI0037A38C6C